MASISENSVARDVQATVHVRGDRRRSPEQPVARDAPGTEKEAGDNPRIPEQLEAEARDELNGIARILLARAEAAFPDKNDPLRIYGEGVAQAGEVHVGAMMKATAAAVARIGGLLTEAQRTAEAQTQAATARAKADRAAAKVEAVAAVRAGLGEMIAVDRRTRIGWAVGIAGLTIVGTFVAAFHMGQWTQRWRDQAAEVGDAAATLAELRQQTSLTSAALSANQVELSEATAGMKQAVTDAGAGLSVLRTLGNLPQAELEAMNGILDALAGSVTGTKPNPQLQAVRELMALSPAARVQAAEFAKIGDAKFRAGFLPIVRAAEERSRGEWWSGEYVYPGCLTNGPSLKMEKGGRIATCLVQIPDSWLSASDAYLRKSYGLPAK